MPDVIVHTPGFLTTVQDRGRFGYAHIGVSQAGAADSIALRIGNLLLGNPDNTPALEMTLVGGSFSFTGDCHIAITGSDFSPRIDGSPVPLWSTFHINRGKMLEFAATKSGARCYLCIRGHLSVPHSLESASTHILSGLGGFSGRALKKGDVLSYTPLEFAFPDQLRTASEDVRTQLSPRRMIRVTHGPQINSFTGQAIHLFSSSRYQVTEESNRVGLRLKGPELQRIMQEDILTEGVSVGAVQVPPNGQPIILFVEQPTTGGYPKIANVISADLPSIGQLKPRDEIVFEYVTIEEALAALRAQEELINTASLIEQ